MLLLLHSSSIEPLTELPEEEKKQEIRPETEKSNERKITILVRSLCRSLGLKNCTRSI